MSSFTVLGSFEETFVGRVYHYPEGHCSICKESNGYYKNEKVVRLDSCNEGHTLHERCMNVWLEHSIACPGSSADSNLQKKVIKQVEKAYAKESVENIKGCCSAVSLVIVLLVSALILL